MLVPVNYTEHEEIEGPEGDLYGESHTWEDFPIISPYSLSGLSASEPVWITDSGDEIPRAYWRLGVGNFQLELVFQG
jgi:hypothetical protein